MPRGVEFTDQQRSVLSQIMRTAWARHKGEEHPKMTKRWVNPDKIISGKKYHVTGGYYDKRSADRKAEYLRNILEPSGHRPSVRVVKEGSIYVIYTNSGLHFNPGAAWHREVTVYLYGPAQREFDPDNIGFLVNARTGKATNRWADGIAGIPKGAIPFIEETFLEGESNPGAAWHKERADRFLIEADKRSGMSKTFFQGKASAHDFSSSKSEDLGMPNPGAPVKAYRCPVCRDYVYMRTGQTVARCETCKAKVGRRADRNPYV